MELRLSVGTEPELTGAALFCWGGWRLLEVDDHDTG